MSSQYFLSVYYTLPLNSVLLQLPEQPLLFLGNVDIGIFETVLFNVDIGLGRVVLLKLLDDVHQLLVLSEGNLVDQFLDGRVVVFADSNLLMLIREDQWVDIGGLHLQKLVEVNNISSGLYD